MIDHRLIQKISGNTGIPEPSIEKDYLIELFLYYLSRDAFLGRYLIFRGGTALKKIYFSDFRYSEDLDFIVKSHGDLTAYITKIDNILKKIKKDFPIEIKQASQFPQKGHLQILLSYNVVPEIYSVKELKIDIVEDDIVLPSRKRKILFSFEDFKTSSGSFAAYDLESIAAEKIGRILDVVDEPRDLWDLWQLMKSELEISIVNDLFYQKYGVPIYLPNLRSAIKKASYKQSWHTRLIYQVPALIDYERIIEELDELLRNNFKDSEQKYLK